MAFAAAVQPLVFTSLIGLIYYRRIRSNFGRQPWRPLRLSIRLGILGLLACALVFAAFVIPRATPGIGIGMLAGVLLGWQASRHTHAEIKDGARYYTPNPWIGGALSLLLIGRLVWRMGSGVFTAGAAQMGQNASPLTLAIFATLVAYYITNGTALMLRMKSLETISANDESLPATSVES
jgi:hypothetical protein